MEFKVFQATRKHVDDIQAAIGFDDDMGKRSGFVYADICYIEELADKSKGAYYLLIERSDWISDDLERLEETLWACFALAEISPDFILSGDDLDVFVRGYCAGHGIECDGDVFGLMFSGKGEFSQSEAANIIEEGARIYDLRNRYP